MKKRHPLKVRQIDFDFGNSVPFYWNTQNVPWGNFVNVITLAAPGFERYFIRAIREAMPRINDPVMAEEADLFCKQEAQHSKLHMNHLKALTAAHPGLEKIAAQVRESYQRIYEEESMEFHLAYAAIVELCFGPIAKYVIENRDYLFKGSNPTIASFMIWHFLEEFEHRNAAIDVYNHVVGSYWYRMKCVPGVFKHLMEIGTLMIEGMNEQVPETYNGFQARDVNIFHKEIPLIRKLSLVYDLVCTLLPYHKPDNIKQPEWAKQWFADEEAGVDMRAYYRL